MVRSAFALAGSSRVELRDADGDDAVTILPASWLAIEFEGIALPPSALLDGATVLLARNATATQGHFVFDAFRSVGFHRLEIDGRRFVFGTDDAKLRMQGVQDLLRYVEAEGLSWGSQLFLGDAATLRDKRIDYAWLVDAGPRIADLAMEVARAPFRRMEDVLVRSQ